MPEMPAPRSIGAAVGDAAWLAHRYDPTHDAFHLLPVPRAVRDAATFLTDENLPIGLKPLVIRRADAMAAKPETGPLHFVFHSAYCCSTVVARAFDRTGWASALKEPLILNDIVGWRRRRTPGPDMASVLDDTLTLLARPFVAGESVIAKPSTAVNALAPGILTLRPEAKALLLYAPLRTYLASIAKKGLDGRLWVRALLLGMMDDGLLDLGLTTRDHLGHTDLQVAALGWLGQKRLFASLVDRFGTARVRTLDSATLMAAPAAAMAAMAAHFGCPLDDDGARDIVSGTAFTRHSKFGTAFDATDRAADHRAASDVHADEIEKVAIWAETVAKTFCIEPTPPAPLLG